MTVDYTIYSICLPVVMLQDIFTFPTSSLNESFESCYQALKPMHLRLTLLKRQSYLTKSDARSLLFSPYGAVLKLSSRFRYLLSTINTEPERFTKSVTAACVLHNFFSWDLLCTPEARFEDGGFFGLTASRGCSSAFGASVREKMCDFFSDKGAVS